MKRIFVFILLSFLVMSCNQLGLQQIPVSDVAPNEGEYLIKLPVSEISKPKYENRLLSSSLGKYYDVFKPREHVTLVSSVKKNPLREPMVRITNIELDKFLKPVTVMQDNSWLAQPIQRNALFGHELADAVASETKVSAILEVEPTYIPEQISILSPAIHSTSDMFPLCYYRNFIIRWNADILNENGVLVMIEWNGNVAFGKSNNNSYIRSIDLVEDNGQTTLNETFFDEIPDSAVCTLTLLRGNFGDLTDNDISQRIIAETHAQLQFILVKEIQNQ